MRKALIYTFTLLCFAAVAPAQVAEFGMFGGANRHSNNNIGSITSTDVSGNTTTSPVSLDSGWKFGFRITLNTGRFMGHEFGYGYNRTQLDIGGQQQGMAIHQGFYDFLIYGMPEGRRVRPFAAGGVHFNNYVPPGSSAASGGGSTKFGFNYGGGVKVRVTNMFLIRFDLRQYRTGKPFDLPGSSGLLNQTEISAGFSLAL